MLREIGASQMERLPTDSEILSMLLNDMATLGLIEFRADAAGGSCWVVSEQNPQTEPIKQDNDRKAA
jgi:hypothetical protein